VNRAVINFANFVFLAGLLAVVGSQASPLSRPTVAAQSIPAPRSLPTFEIDRTWPKLPPKWRVGDASSFAIDARDNVWLLHRPRTLKPEESAMAAPPVMTFDASGTFIKAWGGAGAGYEWPEREHGIYIDDKGYVWITGNNCPTNGLPGLKRVADDQILKFNQDGTFVTQIGRSNQSKGNADTRNVHRAADVWMYPRTSELFVADGYGNHRVAVFDGNTGAFRRMWGAFGNKPVDDDHCEVVTPPSVPEGQGSQNFSTVHAIRVANDGTVYVADRENRRVQAFTANGKFVKQLVRRDTAFARDLALSADPAQQFLYVGNGQEIAIVERRSLDVVGAIKVPGMIGGGHHIASDSKGNIYIAQTAAGMQKLIFKGMSSSGSPAQSAGDIKLTRDVRLISSAGARALAVACTAWAEKNKKIVAMAILDWGGNLIESHAMEGAPANAIDTALLKAKSALRWRRPTSETNRMVRSGENLAPTFMNDFPQPGALPIILNGQVIGAMGVSSAEGEKCAQAAIDAVFKEQVTH
jgi:uncharacterized protein GlcG (DUF336 family)